MSLPILKGMTHRRVPNDCKVKNMAERKKVVRSQIRFPNHMMSHKLLVDDTPSTRREDNETVFIINKPRFLLIDKIM